MLSDNLGSTSTTAAADGSLLDVVKYTAFGEIRDGATATDYRYTGQRDEFEIGLYYYVARYYDPVIGRFISADTMVPQPGSSQAYDRFAYVNNNPINFNDPSGHRACDDYYGRGCNVVPGQTTTVNTNSLPTTYTYNTQSSPSISVESPASISAQPPQFNLDPKINWPMNPVIVDNHEGQTEIGPQCSSLKPCFSSWTKPSWWDTNPKNPDYYSLSINSAVFGISGTIDRYGDFYLTPTFGLGKALTGVTGSFMVGRFGVDGYNNEVLPNFLLADEISGWGINGAIGTLGGLGFNKGLEENSQTAYEFGGLLVASMGLSVGYSFNISQIIREWRR